MKEIFSVGQTSSHCRANPKNGFVTITAVVLIGLVGITISALASMFALEVQRTHEAADGAQLRQLLQVAIRTLPPSPGTATDVPLPELLAQHGAYLHVKSEAKGDSQIIVHVEARFNGRIARETLVYHPSTAGLVLDQANLDQ